MLMARELFDRERERARPPPRVRTERGGCRDELSRASVLPQASARASHRGTAAPRSSRRRARCAAAPFAGSGCHACSSRAARRSRPMKPVLPRYARRRRQGGTRTIIDETPGAQAWRRFRRPELPWNNHEACRCCRRGSAMAKRDLVERDRRLMPFDDHSVEREIRARRIASARPFPYAISLPIIESQERRDRVAAAHVAVHGMPGPVCASTSPVRAGRKPLEVPALMRHSIAFFPATSLLTERHLPRRHAQLFFHEIDAGDLTGCST